MANRVLFKKSSVAARVPLSADLEYGEIAINYADEKIYIKNSSNAIKSFNAGASVSSVALSLPAIFTVSGSPVTTSGTLTWTQNSGKLPTTNLLASIHVYQNGQKLIDSQYSITAPATITIDANTHYDGSNYIVFAININ